MAEGQEVVNQVAQHHQAGMFGAQADQEARQEGDQGDAGQVCAASAQNHRQDAHGLIHHVPGIKGIRRNSASETWAVPRSPAKSRTFKCGSYRSAVAKVKTEKRKRRKTKEPDG